MEKKYQGNAECKLCKALLSYKSTSNNLRKHLMRKHPTISLTEETTSLTKSLVNVEDISDQTQHVRPGPSRSHVGQATLSTYVRKKNPSGSKKRMDEALLLLFIQDLQPFTIVEDVGFKKFISAINPDYQLPSKKYITQTVLPGAYEMAYNNLKELNNIKAVCLTTDTWTSRNTTCFLSLTAHYITNDYELHNAANIKKAIIDDLQLNHFRCYAHTLNLVAKKGINNIELITSKLRVIIGHFKRSTSDNEKFFIQQRQPYPNKNPRKLIQDVVTRWNSTFYMLERFCELEEAIRTTISLIKKELSVITSDEWDIIKELVTILKPLENVTNIICGEKYVTASLAVVLTDGLLATYTDFKNQDFTDVIISVVKSILNGLYVKLNNLEDNNSLALALLLDPRFKTLGFSNSVSVETATNLLQSLVAQSIADSNTNKKNITHKPINVDPHSIWKTFEKQLIKQQPVAGNSSQAIIEVQRYIELPTIERTENSLVWWNKNFHNFPNIANVLQQKCITVATSVPSERIFSKSGFILSDRRNRLGEKNLEKILFLNSNLKM
nr:zinc finger BED domain-containing protein 1-like [Onthophagus taurus]